MSLFVECAVPSGDLLSMLIITCVCSSQTGLMGTLLDPVATFGMSWRQYLKNLNAMLSEQMKVVLILKRQNEN